VVFESTVSEGVAERVCADFKSITEWDGDKDNEQSIHVYSLILPEMIA
jgi:hypothetical protein